MTPEYKKKVVLSAKDPHLDLPSSKVESVASMSTQAFQLARDPESLSTITTGSQSSLSLTIPKEDSAKALLGKRDWLKRSNPYLGSSGNELGLTKGIKEQELFTLVNNITNKKASLESGLPEGAVEFESVCNHNLSKAQKNQKTIVFLIFSW